MHLSGSRDKVQAIQTSLRAPSLVIRIEHAMPGQFPPSLTIETMFKRIGKFCLQVAYYLFWGYVVLLHFVVVAGLVFFFAAFAALN